MRQEIERLALYIGPGSGRTIDVEELETHLGVEPDASLQDAALQAFGGRPAPAQSGLRRALAEGESPVMAVRQASIHLGKLRRINVLQANGAGAKEAAKAAGRLLETGGRNAASGPQLAAGRPRHACWTASTPPTSPPRRPARPTS